MWLARERVRADDDRASRRDVRRRRTAPTRSSCSSTRGPRAAARSSSTRPAPGRYMDYLCDEIVPFVDERYPTAADREHRGLTGKSSGGYGAMVVPMLRPDVFGALASHAGDALFECCYLRELPGRRPPAAGRLRRLLRGLPRAAGRAPTTSTGRASASRSRSTATPARTRPTRRARARRCCRSRSRPAALDRGGLGAVARAAIRCGWRPRHADALRSMRRIYLDAGAGRRVLPRSRRAGVRRRARQAGGRAHAGAVRRQARRHLLPLPGRDPGAGARAGLAARRSPMRR